MSRLKGNITSVSAYMSYLKGNHHYYAYDALRSQGNSVWKGYGAALFGAKGSGGGGNHYRQALKIILIMEDFLFMRNLFHFLMFN